MVNDLPIDSLIAMMRAQPLDLLAPPAMLRASFAEAMSTLSGEAASTAERRRLGHVSALRFCSNLSGPTILYFHGGGYVFGCAEDYAGLAAALAVASNGTVFSAQYRLAPEHPFPAPIQDGVEAYEALLAETKDPSTICLVGDSAGGGLALDVLLRARAKNLPMPGAVVLLSAWADLSCSGGSMESKAAEDPSLSKVGLLAMAHHYLQERSLSRLSEWPSAGDLQGIPPMLLHVGSREILLDDSIRLAASAGAAGVSVRLEVWPGMIHVWHAFSPLLREGREALSSAGNFIQARCGGSV
jgi:acetyl esterase/lipase